MGGGVKPLVELLQPSRPDGGYNHVQTQANAALALSCVCRNHLPNQTTVSEYGGLAQLGVLMRQGGGSRGDTMGVGVVEAEAVRVHNAAHAASHNAAHAASHDAVHAASHAAAARRPRLISL